MKREEKWILAFLILVTICICRLMAADEITASTRLKVKNGEFDLTRNVNQNKIDQTGTSADYHIQVIGTGAVEEVTVIVDVGDNGYCFFRNLTTNDDRYVDVSVTMRLWAGEAALLRVHPTNAINAQAFIGAINLESWVNED